MIDTIVFDFGGVLIDWNPRYLYKNIFESQEEMEWFLSNICTDEWNGEQDKGRTFEEGISILKNKHPDYALPIELFYEKWEHMLNGEISETVEILKKLKEKYTIYGLTNWSAETFPIAYEKYDFLKWFDGIVVSGTEKMVKPDKKIFQLLLDRYHLKAENCIFIDDNKENIKSAAELGFESIHFNTADQVLSILKSKKVL